MNSFLKRGAGILAIALTFLALSGAPSSATDSDKRLFDREKLQVSTGTATCTMSAAVWTNSTAVLTIVPDAQHALQTVRVVFDLDKATTGFAANFTSATIQFSIARKVDGSNWREANNAKTTAVSGTNSALQSIDLDLGVVGPDEQVRIQIKLSAETADFVLPYVVYYRAGVRATITPAS